MNLVTGPPLWGASSDISGKAWFQSFHVIKKGGPFSWSFICTKTLWCPSSSAFHFANTCKNHTHDLRGWAQTELPKKSRFAAGLIFRIFTAPTLRNHRPDSETHNKPRVDGWIQPTTLGLLAESNRSTRGSTVVFWRVWFCRVYISDPTTRKKLAWLTEQRHKIASLVINAPKTQFHELDSVELICSTVKCLDIKLGSPPPSSSSTPTEACFQVSIPVPHVCRFAPGEALVHQYGYFSGFLKKPLMSAEG